MSDEQELWTQLRPEQIEQITQAVRSGQIDALFVSGPEGERLFTLSGADRAYRLLIEEMPEGALTLTPEGVIVYANRRFAEMLGLPLQRVIGTRVQACIVPEQQQALSALLANSRGAKSSVEMDLLSARGDRLPTLLSATPLVGVGMPDAIGMVVIDLTVQKRSEELSRARQSLLEVIKSQKRTEDELRTSVATLRLRESALAAVSQGVLITGPDRRTTYVNRAFEVITGYSAAEMAGRSCAVLQGPDTSAETVRALREALLAARPFQGELLNYRKDGSAFWNELSITPVLDAQGVLSQYVGVQRDISARRQAEAQLLLAAKVFEQSSEGFIITDAGNRIVKVNPAFSAISGFSGGEVLGCDPRMLGSGKHATAFFQSMWQQLSTSGRWQGEVWNRRKDGGLYLAWLALSRVVDSAGQPAHYIGSFSDITQRKEAETNLQRMAYFDLLTRLPNRALLSDRATQALQEAQRNHQSLALMFLDLDNFKNVNDSLGHRIGDGLLLAVAERLTQSVRKQDTVSRVGGDEFVLILPNTPVDGAAHLARKLLMATAQPLELEQHPLTITISIGVALYPHDGGDFETLYKCADAAMYRAKYEGGNAYRLYAEELPAHMQ